MKKLTVRLTSADLQKVMAAAHRLGLSTNKYIVTAALAYDADADAAARLETLLESKLQEQTDAFAAGLAKLAQSHDEQDTALRDSLRGALQKVLAAVRVPEVERALAGAANKIAEVTK
ncbi:MAG TPA: hypothetical protein VFQ95_00240 [Rhodanobacteraceae bacterium]|nr:hypothetical protein [Rhodanobacteraceae bacterium]